MTTTPLRRHTLDNGLRLVVSEDHLAPVVAVNVWYDVGSRHERPGRTGLAHLFEHLMFQGSRNVGPAEHFSLLQGVGATLNGTTSFDRTNYFEAVPTHAYELALWLEADRMGTLLDALTQENLDNQRDVVKNERRQRYDNVPYGTAWEQLFALLYPEDHPYHHLPIGSMADLDATTLDDCRDFFTRHYAPANATLTVVGDVDPDTVVDRVEHYFGQIPTLAEAPEAPDGTIGPRTEGAHRVTHELVPAESRYEVFRVPPETTPDNDALEVGLEVLAGGGASRLVRRLVREEQAASGVQAGVQGLVGGTDVAVIVSRAATGKSLDDLAKGIEEEVARLGSDGPTDEELQRARARLTHDWLDRMTTAMGRADVLNHHETLHGDAAMVDGVLGRIDAVTADAVREAVATWLAPTNRAVLEYREEVA